MGAKVIQKKNKKIGKTGHGAMVCDVIPRKNPNMACQGLISKFFKKVATK
jgi:hypothetical protein